MVRIDLYLWTFDLAKAFDVPKLFTHNNLNHIEKQILQKKKPFWDSTKNTKGPFYISALSRMFGWPEEEVDPGGTAEHLGELRCGARGCPDKAQSGPAPVLILQFKHGLRCWQYSEYNQTVDTIILFNFWVCNMDFF